MGFLITGKNLLLGGRNMPVFDYGQQEVEHLIRRDKKLGEAIKRIGRLEREVIPDLFTALINSIVS